MHVMEVITHACYGGYNGMHAMEVITACIGMVPT